MSDLFVVTTVFVILICVMGCAVSMLCLHWQAATRRKGRSYDQDR